MSKVSNFLIHIFSVYLVLILWVKWQIFLQENIKSFEEELQTIGSVNPILIAFGNDCYKILHTNLQNKYFKKAIFLFLIISWHTATEGLVQQQTCKSRGVAV